MTPTELSKNLGLFSNDPLEFVRRVFPWGEGELKLSPGPEPWQTDLLMAISKGLLTPQEAIQIATTSGHGVGKSALVSWIILWAMSTLEDTVGVVTANTETQLRTKTWVQLAKWFRLFVGNELFRMTATAIFSRDPAHERTWRVDQVPWSVNNMEAFAGLHNQGKRILVVFDEASGIEDAIWETTEGALTDQNTQILWLVFGNPTRNKGRFRECFPGGRFGHRWKHYRVDSRQVSFTNKVQIDRWIQDYGEDHDFVRVRVKGIFPRIDAESFIPYDLARSAVGRAIELPLGFPVVLGVDVGRFGDDPSVIYPRKGRDASSLPIEVYASIDTQQFAMRVLNASHRHAASFIFVDEGGVGGGVVDRLREMRAPVIGVDFGSKPDGINIERGIKYANKRSEIWGGMKDWLAVGSIHERAPGVDTPIVDELTGPNYAMNMREEIQLESKRDMRRRSVGSPNVADALACTFAMPTWAPPEGTRIDMKPTLVDDYNPYARERIYA